MSRMYGLLVTLVCIVFIGYKSAGVILAFDSFCHLQTGLDLIDNGLSPYRDHYSFTCTGQEIFAPPVFFQIILAYLHKWFGTIAGFQIYKGIFFSITLILFYAHLAKKKSHWSIVLLVLPWISLMMFERCLVRPEIISNLLLVLGFFLFFAAKQDFSPKNLIGIFFFQLLWVNFHVHSSVYGYIVFGALYIDQGIKLLIDKPLRRSMWTIWAGFGVLTFLTGFMNVSFSHPVLAALVFDPAWKTLIGEYLPPYRYAQYPFALMYAGLVIWLVPALLVKKEYGPAIIVGVLNVFALKMTRILQPAAYASFIVLIYFLSDLSVTAAWQSSRQSLRRGMTVVYSLIIAVLVWELGTRVTQITPSRDLSKYRFPVDVADFIVNHNLEGNIINEYRIGSYLIYRLFPGNHVYIDGRSNVLYSLELTNRHSLIETSPEALREDSEKYDVEYLVFPDRGDRFKVIEESGMYGVHFAGFRYVLFARKDPNFPISGRLLKDPQVWSDDFLADLDREIEIGKKILPADSMLLPLLRLVEAYSKSENRDALMTQLSPALLPNDSTRRLAAVICEKRGNLRLAVLYRGLVKNKQLDDFITCATHFLTMRLYKEAEGMLFLAFSNRELSASEKQQLIDFLERIRKHQPLQFFPPKFLDDLKFEVGTRGSQDTFSTPDTR